MPNPEESAGPRVGVLQTLIYFGVCPSLLATTMSLLYFSFIAARSLLVLLSSELWTRTCYLETQSRLGE